jgi:ubiquinone/menaquinone biosynthesis C-methylase UbiE
MKIADRMAGFGNPGRYDRRARHLGAGLYAKVVADAAAAGLPGDARVLDVGTGPGRIPRDLAAAHPGWTVDAVDLEPRMIDWARKQDREGRVAFEVADVAALPYPDATFHLIVSSMSQHHWSDVPGAIGELRRVLRPGGLLWIYDVRFALRRAARLAGRAFGPEAVRREPVRATHWPLPVFGRLSARR